MAVSSNYSYNPDLEAIVKQAMRLAGLLSPDDSPSATEVQAGAELLNSGLKNWQTAERLLRNVEKSVEQTLTAGTASYTISNDTMDVEFPAAVTLTSSSTTEYPVERMTLDQYVRITNKAQQGVPTRLLVERGPSVTLTLWPTPDATVSKLRYTRSRLVRDLDAGTTADVQQRYVRAVILMLAVDLAETFNKGDDKIARLERRFEAAKAAIHRDNAERGDVHFRLGGW